MWGGAGSAAAMHRMLLLNGLQYACLLVAAAPSSTASGPHIVTLLTDNMGWANVGFHRPPDVPAREIHTPTIDALAATGLISRRRDCYLMAPACTFSRCLNSDKQGVSSK